MRNPGNLVPVSDGRRRSHDENLRCQPRSELHGLLLRHFRHCGDSLAQVSQPHAYFDVVKVIEPRRRKNDVSPKRAVQAVAEADRVAAANFLAEHKTAATLASVLDWTVLNAEFPRACELILVASGADTCLTNMKANFERGNGCPGCMEGIAWHAPGTNGDKVRF